MNIITLCESFKLLSYPMLFLLMVLNSFAMSDHFYIISTCFQSNYFHSICWLITSLGSKNLPTKSYSMHLSMAMTERMKKVKSIQ
mmetsp:Transcript_5921/g.8607  ORF Transcript_5921/g.8607 Transcript_5921/m.8607 type:complete len:85 (-) Transcript_5921:114-368(-)